MLCFVCMCRAVIQSFIHSFSAQSFIHNTHTRAPFYAHTHWYTIMRVSEVLWVACEIFCFEEKPFFPLSVRQRPTNGESKLQSHTRLSSSLLQLLFFTARTLSFTQIRFLRRTHEFENSKRNETETRRIIISCVCAFCQNKKRKRKKKTRRSYRTGHLYTTENGVQCTTIK